MNKKKLSVVINVRNEADNLEDCLASLKFADEIIVVDMESTDSSREIAKKYTDKIFTHKALHFVEPARNFGISKAIGDWILILDPDERVGKDLADQITTLISEGEYDYVRLPRQNFIFNEWINHSRWWPDYNIRLFRRGAVEWQDEIHSVPITYGKGFNLPAESKYGITHLHYKSLDEYITRALRYSKVQSEEIISVGYKFDLKDLVAKPFSEFISRYFAGEGYKDGLHGFVLSILQAFSIFLIYLRVWEAEGYKKDKTPKSLSLILTTIISSTKEMYYWIYTYHIQNSQNKFHRLFYKIKRKLGK